jgi:uncharacterized protein
VPAYPTLGESWGILGWYLLASIAALGPGMLLLNLVRGLDKSAGTLALVALSYVPLFWWLRRRAGQRWTRPELAHRVPGWLYPALPVLVLAMLVLLSALSYLHLPNWLHTLDKTARTNPLPTLLFGVVVIPACEEILFRGIILPGLLRRYRPWLAIGQSALLFAVIHANPAQSVPVFFMGLLLGALYYYTRSLWVCWALHALNNALAFGSASRATTQPDHRTMVQLFHGPTIYALCLLGSALYTGVVLWQLRQWAMRPLSALGSGGQEAGEPVVFMPDAS